MRHSIKDQILVECKSLLFGYPNFIFSGNDYRHLDGIPVFVFHTIDPTLFESQLLFLKRNDYKTLSIHEFYEILGDSGSLENNKAVLLTIDDARSSVWRYAFPLLRKYKMNAAVFMIPGWTIESNGLRKNLMDVWEGGSTLEEINDLDPSDRTLCTWSEISEMYNSGFVNIESHTLLHREVFTGTKIIEFFENPTSSAAYNFPASGYLNPSTLATKIKTENYLGLPLFESDSFLSNIPRLDISEEFKIICRNIYKEKASDGSNWKNEVETLVRSSEKKYFSLINSAADITVDLQKSKEIIQNKLGNGAGNHLCLPWTIGNNEVIDILKGLKIKSCFWGVLPGKRINKPGSDPYFISRIKNDFIFRLPGKNRKSLISLYFYKLKRRLAGEKIF